MVGICNSALSVKSNLNQINQIKSNQIKSQPVKLQMDADLTLDKAVRAARETESVTQQQKLLRSDFQEAKPLGYVRQQSK